MDIYWMTLIVVILLIVVGYFILSMISSSFSSSKVSTSITKLNTQTLLPVTSTYSFTFSIWIYINNFYKNYSEGQQLSQHIISTGLPSPPQEQIFLLTLDMNSNILNITIGQGSYRIPVNTVPLQTWVSIIVTLINGNSADIYINGKLFKTVVPPPHPFWYGTCVSPDFKDVIKDKNIDPTAFKPLTDAGQEMRNMFDRRTNSYIDVNAYLFKYKDNDGFEIEVQVNPEFSQDQAREYARNYAIVIGQLPKALRRDVKTVWIHNGNQPFGGGNNNVLIHVERGDDYIQDGILEEVMIHEASHASLDGLYENDPNWINSQQKDNAYISTYAKNFPRREDVAESFLAYFAHTYRKDRITSNTYNRIISTIPNRIKFFDSKTLDMSPYTKSSPSPPPPIDPPAALYLLPAGSITVGGYNLLDGYISTTFDNKSIGPQEAWNIYSSGYGGGGGSGSGSGLSDFFNKYKIRFAFVKDNVELSRLDI